MSFIIVALVGGAAEMVSAFSGARKNRLVLSVGIALFVAPVLVLMVYLIFAITLYLLPPTSTLNP